MYYFLHGLFNPTLKMYFFFRLKCLSASAIERMSWPNLVLEIVCNVCLSFCSPLWTWTSPGSELEDLGRLFLMVHESCKENGATPSQYMSFLHVYRTLHGQKQNQLTRRRQHLQVKVHHFLMLGSLAPSGFPSLYFGVVIVFCWNFFLTFCAKILHF